MTRPPPHDADLEWSVVSNVMDEPERLGEVEAFLRPEHFYTDQNRSLFAAVTALAGRGAVPDVASVRHEMVTTGTADRYGGVARMTAFIDRTPYTAQLAQNARRVVALAQVRTIIATAQRIAAQGYTTDTLKDVDTYRSKAGEAMYRALEQADASTYARASDEVGAYLAEARGGAEGAAVRGLATGFNDLDKLVSLRLGSVNILAARPGMGKSALVLAVLGHIIAQDPAAYGESERTAAALFTLEMSTREVALRIIAAGAKVGLSRLIRGTHDDAMVSRAEGGEYRKPLDQLFIDARVSTVPELRIRVRQMRADAARRGHTLRVVAVDYLQLMRGADPRHREQEVAAISRGLKAMALEENLVVLALSQLNRGVESRAEPRPKLSDLRESGSIEQDADTVMFLFSQDYYNRDKPDFVPSGVVNIDVAKNRHGPNGDVEVGFDGEHTRFYNLAPRHAYHTARWNHVPRLNAEEK